MSESLSKLPRPAIYGISSAQRVLGQGVLVVRLEDYDQLQSRCEEQSKDLDNYRENFIERSAYLAEQGLRKRLEAENAALREREEGNLERWAELKTAIQREKFSIPTEGGEGMGVIGLPQLERALGRYIGSPAIKPQHPEQEEGNG